jgi:hypothetical protein
MTAKGKREFWLIASVVTIFPTMILFVALIIDSYFRVQRLSVGRALPTMESVLTDFGDRWGYGLLGTFALASWFSYKKYNKCAGLEPENEE